MKQLLVTKGGLFSQSLADHGSNVCGWRHPVEQIRRIVTSGNSTEMESNRPFHQYGGRTVM